MAARDDGAERLVAILDHAPGLVLLVDAETRVQWINEPAAALFGYPIEDAIGRSVLDFLDPDWDPEAFESIATAMGGSGQRQPMLFRAVRSDGTSLIVEVTANTQMDHPALEGMVCYVRPWEERYLLDEALEAMAASRPLEETLELLVQVAAAETLEAEASVLHDRVGDWFAGAVAAPSLDPRLVGPTAAHDEVVVAAWEPLLRASDGQVHEVADLPAELREPALAAGFETLWVWPSERIGDRPAQVAVVAWRREPHLDIDQTRRQAMGRLARLAGLVLERIRGEEATAHAAAHDALTGLANRARFYDELESALEVGPVGVLYLDLDGFKPVNDELGHGVGDLLLVEVARRVRRSLPDDALAARLGGDEFAVVWPGAGEADLLALGGTLVDQVGHPVTVGDHEVRVGASVGGALSEPGTAPDRLVEAADVAQYEAKAGGGATVVLGAVGAEPPGPGRPYRSR